MTTALGYLTSCIFNSYLRFYTCVNYGFLFPIRDSQDVQLPKAGQYATGILFLDQEEGLRKESQTKFEQGALDLGLKVLGWRDVPKDPSCLGSVALRCEPFISQVRQYSMFYLLTLIFFYISQFQYRYC